MRLRRDALREYSRGSLWLMPAVAAAVSIGVGAVLSRIRVGPHSLLAFQGTADDARSVLITISGTMVTVIALLLGLAVVALQLSSTQFSPRLLRNFLRDRPNQLVLSVFVGTFAYSAAGLFQVGVSGGQRVDDYPRLAVSVAMALMFFSLALLVFFADHLAHSIQVDYILRVVERSTLRVIRQLPAARDLPEVPPGAVCVPAPTSGYVQVVHMDEVLAMARLHAVHIRFRPRVGEHVVAGTPFAWIWPTATGTTRSTSPLADLAPALYTSVRIGFERTLEQDPGLGMRQLVDAACKALSPAVNDPYTAIQAVEHMSVLYLAMARSRIGNLVRTDGSGNTVAVPAFSLADHLGLGIGLIRRYGASEPTVVQALLRLLVTVVTALGDEPEGLSVIEEHAGLLLTAARREIVEPADLALVERDADSLRDAVASTRNVPAEPGAGGS